MLVRVFDNKSNVYFKSEVYAVINSGWYEKRLVVYSSGNERFFQFFDYFDKSDPKEPKVLIHLILPRIDHSEFEWIYKKTGDVSKQLDDYAGVLGDGMRFFDYRGYSWIYEDKQLLSKLLKGERVSTKGFEHLVFDSSAYKLDGWNYVETQRDIDYICEQTASLHDSVLKELSYVSGAYVDENNFMYASDSERRISMRFDSQWRPSVEMIFEGVTAMNLRPSSDNYSSNIYGAAFLLQDTSIYFCDDMIDDMDESYAGTWVKAYSLRWRFA